MDKLISLTDLAKRWGLSKQRVSQFAARDRIPVVRIGRAVFARDGRDLKRPTDPRLPAKKRRKSA